MSRGLGRDLGKKKGGVLKFRKKRFGATLKKPTRVNGFMSESGGEKAGSFPTGFLEGGGAQIPKGQKGSEQ